MRISCFNTFVGSIFNDYLILSQEFFESPCIFRPAHPIFKSPLFLSPLQGYSGNHTYVASQGPLPQTVIDFWRMVWESKATIIVMSCNEYEMGKVSEITFGPLTMYNSKVDLSYMRGFDLKVVDPVLDPICIIWTV